MRPRIEPRVRSPLAPALLRHLSSSGVEPAEVARRLGLPAGTEAAEEAEISPRDLTALFEAVADALGEPHLGLRLPFVLHLERYDLSEIAVRASATAHDALARVARYAALLHPDLGARIDPRGGEVEWVVTWAGSAARGARHVREYALAYAVAQLRLGGCEPRVVRARFEDARPRSLGPLEAFLRTDDLTFGEKDSALVFEASGLTLPMRTADPKLLATVASLADRSLSDRARGRSFASLVEAKIPALLPDRAHLEAAALAMHMSPRTLQRRLDEEGTRFSEVLDRARERLAREWLRDDAIGLVEVSQRLGFSELATFSRAFKRWTGKPPGLWRRRREAGTP